MKEYYLPIVKACDRGVASMLSRICVDPDNFYRGTLDDMTYLTEPDAGRQQGYIALIALARRAMEECIDLLGFSAPERM